LYLCPSYGDFQRSGARRERGSTQNSCGRLSTAGRATPPGPESAAFAEGGGRRQAPFLMLRSDCPSWARTRTLLIQNQTCCQLHQGAPQPSHLAAAGCHETRPLDALLQGENGTSAHRNGRRISPAADWQRHRTHARHLARAQPHSALLNQRATAVGYLAPQ
jgi:hypothetical protein